MSSLQARQNLDFFANRAALHLEGPCFFGYLFIPQISEIVDTSKNVNDRGVACCTLCKVHR